MSTYLDRVNHELKAAADLRYDEFFSAGHAAPGRNGPYAAVDTPVRNTGHWLIIYTYLWKTTGELRYRTIAERFCDYLLEMQTRSVSGAIECMSDKGADHLNGLIGQAWTIEALVYAYQAYGSPQLWECALKIFRSQKFVMHTGLWRVVELDGTVCDYDKTINHQVWFGIAGLLLLQDHEEADIREQVERHFHCVRHEYFGAYPSGLIRHYGPMRLTNRTFAKFYAKQRLKHVLQQLHMIKAGKINSLEQEDGYHLFELYGYAVVKQLRPDEPLFQTKAFGKAVSYDRDIDRLHEALKMNSDRMNPYAYGYNSPAYEYPFVRLMFNGNVDETASEKLLDTHAALMTDPATGLHSRNNSDPETLMARMYELVRCCEQLQQNTASTV